MDTATNSTADASNHEESSPLLTEDFSEDEKKASSVEKDAEASSKAPPSSKAPQAEYEDCGYGWTANGLPVGHGSVVGEPMERSLWNSSLFACIGRNDEFCSSDLEVCLLGSISPCLLYGSNVEWLGSARGTFASHCLQYAGLYLIGNSFFGWNCIAPWFSYPSRTAIRRKFNLEGSCEALHRSCGCCGGIVEDEVALEQCETTCDLATHVLCHPCALCQEGRELRRRLPHPVFTSRPGILYMVPPREQTMGGGA
ncbi:hypothetical protein SAY86_025308 [Trapa natans]|uniref:Cell number regulator 8 n=1 Tax=Trapa natans TaxID=22666 RepID=A0AAN7MWW6_TRANT|nr:hypothetical protein SAY86_025308 [Trapa natans]